MCLFRRCPCTRTVGVIVFRATGFQVNAFCPRNFVDEWSGIDEFAVGAIQDIKEAVTVSMTTRFDDRAIVFFQVEGDEFVYAVKVPTVVRCPLVVPFDFAIRRIDGENGGGVQVIARAQMRVPRRRIARAEEQAVGFSVVSTA